MYAYDIMVLAKGKHPEMLTYFGNSMILPLSRVIVPLRKKDVRALVLSSVPLAEIKGEIKSSDFALRKIKKIVGAPMFSQGYIETVQNLARFYVARESALLTQCIPVALLEYMNDSTEESVNSTKQESASSPFKTEHTLLTCPLHERIDYYKTLIRESFAKNLSLYICVPTVEDAEMLKAELGTGIHSHVYAFHSGRTTAQIHKDLRRVLSGEHASLVIGTVPYLSIPLPNLRAIIVEHETSQSYMSMGGQSIDLKLIPYTLAQIRKIPLIVSDTFPSIQAYANKEEGVFTMSSRSSLRISGERTPVIVDMKSPDEKGGNLIGTTLRNQIQETLARGEDVFLFALKEGLGAHVLCQDCGESVTCTQCGGGLGLRYSGTQTIFWCKLCKREYSSLVTCEHCGSWKLKELGVGVDSVEREIKELFPDTPRMTLGSVKNKTEEAKLESLLDKRGAIILGTPRALAVMPHPVGLVAVVSFDSLLFYPHYAIGERILSLLSLLLDMTSSKLYIQTRDAHFSLLEHISRGTLNEWYKEELALRKQFGYPPYTNILELRYDRAQMEPRLDLEEKLTRLFAPHQPQFVEKASRGTYSAIIKIPRDFYTLENARSHPLYAVLTDAQKAGAHILWNSPSL